MIYAIKITHSQLEYVIIKIFEMMNVSDIDVNVHRDQIDILNSYDLLMKSNSIVNLKPELANEWDYTKNTHISPNHFGGGFHRNVWWKCSVCGYE